MTKVETLVEHRNSHGEAERKKVGDVYEVPDQAVSLLVGEGVVAKVSARAKDG